MRIEGSNPLLWSRVEQIYGNRGQRVSQVQGNNSDENRIITKIAHQEEAERPRERETYNREGERVSYVPPGKVFEAQG